jgi:hypothetical protein
MTRRRQPEARTTFRVDLRVEPHVADATRTLRRGLKYLLRACGLRAVSTIEVQPDTSNQIAGAFHQLRCDVQQRRARRAIRRQHRSNVNE